MIAPANYWQGIGDLNSRRRVRLHEGTVGTAESIDAHVPLAQMFQLQQSYWSLIKGVECSRWIFYYDVAPLATRCVISTTILTQVLVDNQATRTMQESGNWNSLKNSR